MVTLQACIHSHSQSCIRLWFCGWKYTCQGQSCISCGFVVGSTHVMVNRVLVVVLWLEVHMSGSIWSRIEVRKIVTIK